MFTNVWHFLAYRFILFLSPQDVVYTSQNGAMNHFKYNILAKGWSLSNLPVYLLFISIYKPHGRYKSFQYNMLAKCMALSNLLVYLIFISIYKPYGRYKSFQHKLTGLFDSCIHKTWSIQAMMALWTIFSTICLPNVWRSQIYWFILSLFLYTSHMGAINHGSTICLPRYGTLKPISLSYLYFYIQAVWAL